MAINPTYNIMNASNVSQSIIDLLLGVTNEAFRLWSEALAGDADASVRIEIVDSTPGGGAEGAWQNQTSLGMLDGLNVIIGAPAWELQTGSNLQGNATDILLRFQVDNLLNELFLDPTPETRDDIPDDRTDGLSVILHEIGHALGFLGFYNTDTNQQGGFATPYDLRRIDVGDQDFFSGPNVTRHYGGDVELTDGNYAHYGNSRDFPGFDDNPLLGLMNGVVYYRSWAYEISNLDLAILADQGLGTILDDILDRPLQQYMRGGAGNDELIGSDVVNFLFGDEGHDSLFGNGGGDLLTGGLGNDTLDGGSNVDTAVLSGIMADYTVNQTATGVFEISGADGTDTLTNIEFAQFDDQTMRLLPGQGISVNFETADPSVYQTALEGLRDFDGNALGGDGNWLRIGSADVNGDGDIDQILVNNAIGRFATVGTAPDGLTYFDDFSWAGETRVAGTYIDPLVQSGDVVQGSDNDSQRRFQNDLEIENINRVLGADDYDGDGIHEVYFALTDGTAYLRALMHEDGNIRYANYQSEQEVRDYLTANGYDEATFGDWFSSGAQSSADILTFVNVAEDRKIAGMPIDPQSGDSLLASESEGLEFAHYSYADFAFASNIEPEFFG